MNPSLFTQGRRRPHAMAVVGFAVLAALSGCGGSGGGDASPPPVVTPPPPATAPVIATQPTDQTAASGQSATFSVSTSGAPALSYQWTRNGVPIPGATASTYTTGPLGAADNFAVYRAVLRNGDALRWTDKAVLTVTAQGVLPVLGTPGLPADSAAYSAVRGERGLDVDSQGRPHVLADAGLLRVEREGALVNVASQFSSAACSSNAGDVAADQAGNLYVICGRTVLKRGGGTLVQVYEGEPRALAVGSGGRLYVAEQDRIHRVEPDGTRGLLAGGGPAVVEPRDGTGLEAGFVSLHALTIDAQGTLYAADGTTVRKITPAGVVSTVAGGASAPAAARFESIGDIVAERTGDLVVTDPINRTIRRISPAGLVTPVAGAAGESAAVDGVGAAARFIAPNGLGIDTQGTLYVADGDRIRSIAADARVATIAGPGSSLDPAGTLQEKGQEVRWVSGEGIAVDAAGNLYFARAHEVFKVDRSATPVLHATPGNPSPLGSSVDYLAFGGKGSLYALLVGRRIVRVQDPVRVDSAGQVTSLPIAANPQAGAPIRWTGVAADADDNGYFAGSQAIRVCTGTVCELQDRAEVHRSAAGAASASLLFAAGPGVYPQAPALRFSQPGGVAVARDGSVYLADRGNHVILRISAGGQASVVAGAPGTAGSANGDGPAARFNQPDSLAVDGAGNLYVADTGNATIRKVTPAGQVSTHASVAQVRHIAAAADGTLYLSVEGGIVKVVAPVR